MLPVSFGPGVALNEPTGTSLPRLRPMSARFGNCQRARVCNKRAFSIYNKRAYFCLIFAYMQLVQCPKGAHLVAAYLAEKELRENMQFYHFIYNFVIDNFIAVR